jgi:hypothetical protein
MHCAVHRRAALLEEVAASVKPIAARQAQIIDIGQAILDDNALAAAKAHLVRPAADHATRMFTLAALDEAVRSFEPTLRRVALFFAVARRLPRISSGSELFRTVPTPAGLIALLLVCEIRADAGQIRRPAGRSSRSACSRTCSRPMARAAVAHPREHERARRLSPVGRARRSADTLNLTQCCSPYARDCHSPASCSGATARATNASKS